jgi:hypothetical protein
VAGRYAEGFPIMVRGGMVSFERAPADQLSIMTALDMQSDESREFIRPRNLSVQESVYNAAAYGDFWKRARYSMNKNLGTFRQPMREEPVLFRQFADIKTADDALMFANAWGGLGYDACWAMAAPPGAWGEARADWAEPVDLWLRESAMLSDAVRLWDVIRSGDAGAMRERIFEADVWRVELGARLPPARPVPADDFLGQQSSTWDVEIPAEFARDPAMACKMALMEVIDIGLQGRVDLKFDPGEAKSQVMPISLAGAIWAQFLFAVEGRKDVTRCAACDTWMDAGVGKGGKAKKYCSNKCKQRIHRMGLRGEVR